MSVFIDAKLIIAKVMVLEVLFGFGLLPVLNFKLLSPYRDLSSDQIQSRPIQIILLDLN